MSQRMHTMNMDTVHCDTYARSQKRGKIESLVGRLCQPKRDHRERSTPRNQASTGMHINLPPSKTKSANARQINDLKSDSTIPSVIHRELYTDNPALVEVTVKTHNANARSQCNSRSTSRSRSREPWSKLLKQRASSEQLPSFHTFDPLRTIHFLARELHAKLVDSSSDRAILQMVSEMQQALNRVPPEVASTVMLHPPRDDPRKPSSIDIKSAKKGLQKECDLPIDEKLIYVVKPPSKEGSSQTPKNNYEAEKLQKHLEESSAKIEAACKQMEAVCTRLKTEKEELEIMLRAERETVKFLRKQMENCDAEKTEQTNNKIQALQQERDNLQSQLKKVKAQLETQQNLPTTELKAMLEDLRNQKSESDEQIALLNHQLTLISMEKEKYVAILSARDRQIKEIRAEMTQLQEVVNEQLVELQAAPCSSIPSTASNMTSEQASWTAVKIENKKKAAENVENLTPSSINTDESTLEQLFLKDKMPASSFKELPSGDSSGTTVMEEVKKAMRNRQDALKAQKMHAVRPSDTIGSSMMSEVHSNIRDMFAEIK
ncbi:hypothetical protein AMK59_5646, partial [Oryctes borbonicus]